MSVYGALELKVCHQRHLACGLAVSVLLFISLLFSLGLFGGEIPVVSMQEERGRIKLIPFPKPKPAPPAPPSHVPRPPAPSQPKVGAFVLDSFLDLEYPEQLKDVPDSPPLDYPVDGDAKGPGNEVSNVTPVDLDLEGLTPEILHRVEPGYPAMARELGITETMTAELLVGKDGFVREVTILKNRTGVFDDEVRAALKKWIFRPLVRDGRVVSFRYAQTVRFRLSR